MKARTYRGEAKRAKAAIANMTRDEVRRAWISIHGIRRLMWCNGDRAWRDAYEAYLKEHDPTFNRGAYL